MITAAGTAAVNEWQTFPLTAAMFLCITLPTTAEVVSLDCVFWKLKQFCDNSGDTTVRIVPAATVGSIDRAIDISSGQFDCAKEI